MEGDIHTEAQGPPSPTAQKVLDAAVDLLRATGQLSMRKLAQSANVAGMTPYNLFGSKQGLLAALSQKELGHAIRRVGGAQVADSLDRMFAEIFQAPRTVYWNLLLDACRDEGFLVRLLAAERDRGARGVHAPVRRTGNAGLRAGRPGGGRVE